MAFGILAILLVTVLFLFINMFLSAMAAAAAKKRDYPTAHKYAMVVAVLSSMAIVGLAFVLGIYIYDDLKLLAARLEKSRETAPVPIPSRSPVRQTTRQCVRGRCAEPALVREPPEKPKVAIPAVAAGKAEEPPIVVPPPLPTEEPIRKTSKPSTPKAVSPPKTASSKKTATPASRATVATTRARTPRMEVVDVFEPGQTPESAKGLPVVRRRSPRDGSGGVIVIPQVEEILEPLQIEFERRSPPKIEYRSKPKSSSPLKIEYRSAMPHAPTPSTLRAKRRVAARIAKIKRENAKRLFGTTPKRLSTRRRTPKAA